MSRLQRLTKSDLSDEQRAVYDAIVGSGRGPYGDRGYLPGPFNAMLHNPTVGNALQSVGAALRFDGCIAPQAREMAILTVARFWQCEYEWHSHEAAGRAVGLTPEQIALVRANDSLEAIIEPIEHAAVAVTRTLLAIGDLSDDEYAEAVATIGVAGLVEVTTLVGYYSLLAMQLRVFRVGLDDALS